MRCLPTLAVNRAVQARFAVTVERSHGYARLRSLVERENAPCWRQLAPGIELIELFCARFERVPRCIGGPPCGGHPMQSLCMLRNHCRQWPRNTRYQADATPYLGRTSTGWIAPALPGALIRSPRRQERAEWAAARDQAPWLFSS
jgi:hypothetical protein